MLNLRLAIVALAATSCAAFAPSTTTFVSSRASTSLNANIVDTLATLQGPGQVWGAEGIAVGKEESELKGYDNFDLVSARLASTGVAETLKGPGPFTFFAPTNSAIESYEKTKGPVGAAELNYCIVPGMHSSSALSNLQTLQGETLTYSRKFRKDFMNDAIIGEKAFGGYGDFPTDLACDNGVIHSISIMLAPGYTAA